MFQADFTIAATVRIADTDPNFYEQRTLEALPSESTVALRRKVYLAIIVSMNAACALQSVNGCFVVTV